MEHGHAAGILIAGLVALLAPPTRAALGRLGVPEMVGYLALGFALRAVGEPLGLLGEVEGGILGFLGQLGLALLLFRAGLENEPAGLLRKLPDASVIWLPNMALAGAAGWFASHVLLGWPQAASLVVGTAFTATSVGVSLAPWQELGLLSSERGRLLVDVAELDDISGVVLMGLLFAVLPALEAGGDGALGLGAAALGGFAWRLVLFGGICVVYARYAEPRLSRFAQAHEDEPSRMLSVVGTGLIVAALGAWLGFSLAIGALFAGLMFSRDPEAVRTESNFENLYRFFTPFFFIHVGLQPDPAALPEAAGAGLLLLLWAVGSKVIGTAVPAGLRIGWMPALALGVSMVPRAEITMVIMETGRRLGDDLVTPQIYAAMLLVSAGTCLVGPWATLQLLRRGAAGPPGPRPDGARRGPPP